MVLDCLRDHRRLYDLLSRINSQIETCMVGAIVSFENSDSGWAERNQEYRNQLSRLGKKVEKIKSLGKLARFYASLTEPNHSFYDEFY